MRIVGLKEFMELGPVLYKEYDDYFHCRGNFNIKWGNSESIPNDWVFSQIAPHQLDAHSFENRSDKLQSMEKDSSVTAAMDFKGTMREAMYYEDDDPVKFAVYEKDDIENLINTLQSVLNLGGE